MRPGRRLGDFDLRQGSFHSSGRFTMGTISFLACGSIGPLKNTICSVVCVKMLLISNLYTLMVHVCKWPTWISSVKNTCALKSPTYLSQQRPRIYWSLFITVKIKVECITFALCSVRSAWVVSDLIHCMNSFIYIYSIKFCTGIQIFSDILTLTSLEVVSQQVIYLHMSFKKPNKKHLLAVNVWNRR